jgi:hypothetical protein
VISSGTQLAAGRGDNLRSQQYSKRQGMPYEKKRPVGSQDKNGSVAEFMGEMALDGGAWGAASPS